MQLLGISLAKDRTKGEAIPATGCGFRIVELRDTFGAPVYIAPSEARRSEAFRVREGDTFSCSVATLVLFSPSVPGYIRIAVFGSGEDSGTSFAPPDRTPPAHDYNPCTALFAIPGASTQGLAIGLQLVKSPSITMKAVVRMIRCDNPNGAAAAFTYGIGGPFGGGGGLFINNRDQLVGGGQVILSSGAGIAPVIQLGLFRVAPNSYLEVGLDFVIRPFSSGVMAVNTDFCVAPAAALGANAVTLSMDWDEYQ